MRNHLTIPKKEHLSLWGFPPGNYQQYVRDSRTQIGLPNNTVEGFKQFTTPVLQQTRGYILEKEEMGFLDSLWLGPQNIYSNTPRLVLVDVQPNIWKSVMLPELQRLVDIEIRMIEHQKVRLDVYFFARER